MSYWIELLSMRAELLNLGTVYMHETLDYFKSAGISMCHAEKDYSIGIVTVANVQDHGNHRFDFTDKGGFRALVCEALAEDAETTIDLVAWPLDRPAHVMSAFGKCAYLGAFDVHNPATYCMGYPLVVHKTPLDYMRAGFRGAAIVTPKLAARQFIDIPGQIAAQDYRHGRDLKRLIESVIPRDRVVVPAQPQLRRAA